MLVSIVICNYNYGRFLARAIESALAQTYANAEVIVVDDGSTDQSPQVIAGFADRIRSVSQRNEGQVGAYNRGFVEARGDVVVFLDADDMLDPNASSEIAMAFADASVVKVHYRLRLVDAADRLLGDVIPRKLDDGDVSWMLRNGLFYDSSPGSGNAYRRRILSQLHPFPSDPSDRHGADFYALMGVSLLGRVRALGPVPLGSYRVHAQQDADRIAFGNAGPDEARKSQLRYRRLRDWLIARLGPSYELPKEFVDFSIHKQLLANSIFDRPEYFAGLRDGYVVFSQSVLPSIWRGRGALTEKAGLTGWALAVLVLPRGLGRPIARYVCNPASRSTTFPPWIGRMAAKLSRG